MPAPKSNTLNPTGTDETERDASGAASEDTPYEDPLAVMFGMPVGDDEGTADEGQPANEDEESDEDAEAEAEEDTDSAGDDTDGEEDGTGAESDEDEAASDDDESESAVPAADKKWQEQVKKLPPEAQKMVHGMRERIDKLTVKREKLKGELETERAEKERFKTLAEAQTGTPLKLAASTDNPLAELTNPDEVTSTIDQAQRTLDWCDDNEDGGVEVSDGKGGMRELSKQEIRDIKRNAQAVVNRHGPARLKWLQDHSAAQTEAKQKYPRLFEVGETQLQARELLKQYPELLKNPRHMLAVGDLLIGRAVRQGKLVTIKAGQKKTATSSNAAPAKAKPATSLSAASSTSAPVSKKGTSGKAPLGLGALHKAVLDGTGDPLDLMFSAGADAE